ncbi:MULTISPECIES: hypothetical protein [unclassified Streptomyces]|uniref:hypothetical protein n=1 Tax=unclassified Streptomyces TaxID=2593676 RepID=UPI001BEC3CF9|nr:MULTISPECIES: hypothetical protein [unclassified Streptomyces]MBT2408047.1 hypothetical protein [Streptomyces sp. ISL-21]MBT2458881.1 hypothetical protein [Streptomyces sp. ISL-86]MBT2611397.1 hypothetical protein [Streptomyces sp. ISL-87]
MIPLIALAILGVLLLAGAVYVLRGVHHIRKAKRLTAEVAVLEAQTEASTARTAAIEADEETRQAAEVVALGFVPEADLDTVHPAPVPAERTAVLAALADGDWEVGAAYVKAAGRDWEERWQRVRVLADAAVEDDAWLLAWRSAKPSHVTGALVHAETAVRVAWKVRGGQSGSRTTQEQFRVFGELLRTAQKSAHEAQRLADPADPVPYMVEQHIGHGLGYSHERYETLWAQIVARDPKVLSAHTNALQYWCQKWRGSHELALAFARQSAAAGEPGELLSLLPLLAYFEEDTHEPELAAEVFYKDPEIVAAVDAAVQDLAAADADDPRAVRMRHMLAYLLFWQDRDAAAAEQFRHIDGYIGALPWTYAGSPKSRYVYARDWAVRVSTPGM